MSVEHGRAPLPLPDVAPLEAPADFAARAAAIGAHPDAEATRLLGAHLALLLAMNEQMNLTAITAHDEAWTRHVLDSLTVLPALAGLPPGARVLDVGSGGGLPGVPIAILRPDLEVTLLDATEKKVAFLSAVAGRLGLANLRALRGRAEELAPGTEAARWDAVTARAVAKVATLAAWTVPFAKRGGRIVLIKGARAELELIEARKVLARLRARHESTTVTPTGRVVVLRAD